jgi:multisubunit Na+/H+ antiporter MnhB subunit
MRKPAFMVALVALVALVVWVFVGTLSLSRWWYANPNFFPHFPDGFWSQLDRLFGANNVDEASNVEFFIVVLLALIAVLVFTAVVAAIYHYVKKRD